MAYTYDTDHAPIWRDTNTGDLVQMPPVFEDMQPAPIDAGELRRDAIAAASQAPRIQ